MFNFKKWFSRDERLEELLDKIHAQIPKLVAENKRIKKELGALRFKLHELNEEAGTVDLRLRGCLNPRID